MLVILIRKEIDESLTILGASVDSSLGKLNRKIVKERIRNELTNVEQVDHHNYTEA